jgi:hypothetical protein
MTRNHALTPEPITATLTTAGARVRVVASDRSDTVVLVEPIDSTNESHVKVAEKTEVDLSAGELSIKTTKPGDKDGSIAITIELPAASRLALNTAWTEVRADGRFGDCVLNVSSGQVRLDHIAALRGNVGAGAVAIGRVAGTATLDGGDRGSIDIDRAEGDVTARAGNCPIRIGRMTRGRAELSNASGGIEVGIGEGTAASVDAKSTKGAVRNSVPTRESGTEVTVHARTRLDDIVIHPAAG